MPYQNPNWITYGTESDGRQDQFFNGDWWGFGQIPNQFFESMGLPPDMDKMMRGLQSGEFFNHMAGTNMGNFPGLGNRNRSFLFGSGIGSLLTRGLGFGGFPFRNIGKFF